MTNSEVTTGTTACWCGNADLVEFNGAYARCPKCGTLVSHRGLSADEAAVRDDERDFYGKTYWLAHQRDVLGLPDIHERARLDLPERCLHWLRSLLGYAVPPARILEVGSGHGAFVALLRWAGFDASGLEVSPWVVDFARTTFEVPMLLGTLEAQELPAGSLDAIVLNDVLEHLSDPLGSMRHCADLLRPGGFALVQTPRYPDPDSYDALVRTADPFLAMLQEREHLHLFSERGARQLFAEVGLRVLRFEPAFFPYDMFFVASREELIPTRSAARGEALLRSPGARLTGAMLDLDERSRALSQRVRDVERDRQERIQTIERLNRHIADVGSDYEARLAIILEQQATIEQLNQHIGKTSADYEARLAIILEQQATIERQNQHIEKTSSDYEARLKVILEQQAIIERQNQHVERMSIDYEARLKVILDQQAMIERLNQHIEKTSADYGVGIKAILDQQASLERLREESLRASPEVETRQRLVDERMSEIVLLKDQLARVASGAEAQMRLIGHQQTAIEDLLEQERGRAKALEGRLHAMEGRQGEVDALLQGRLVRLLRSLRLL